MKFIRYFNLIQTIFYKRDCIEPIVYYPTHAATSIRQKNGIVLIATKLEIRGSKLTGKFASQNCHCIEKVNRIKEIYDLDDYEYIYAYGDSSGDKELLALADESFYKPFRN